MSTDSSLSRRRFLATASATAGGLAIASLPMGTAVLRAATPSATPVATPPVAPSATPVPAAEPARHAFRSRPDLRPPVIEVTGPGGRASDRLFLTPRFGGGGEGVMIADASGEPVWLRRVPGRAAAGLRPMRFAGEPAIGWWEGTIERGLGDGEFVIVDRTYREVVRIRTVAHPADLHELILTEDGTAYVLAMDIIELDGRTIDDMLVQEIEIDTGRLRWEWRASEHIALEESVEPLPDEGPWDYLHLNSIGLDDDGGLLLSARHTDAIYKVDRRTGDVVWRLGGTRSDFRLPADAVFVAQHDARRLPDGTLSLFDNATKDPEATDVQSRGLILRLDEAAGTAEIVRVLASPRRTVSSSQGSLTVRRDGSAVIGWGSARHMTGYAPDGSVTFDAAMPSGYSSYRAYAGPWTGRPADQPIVRVGAADDGVPRAWVSWNGATEVDTWLLLAGDRPGALRPTGERIPRSGFETGLDVPSGTAFLAVRALDGSGEPLGTSRPVPTGSA